MKHSGIWADEPIFSGLFEFMFTRPGGGYPQKVDQMIDAFCKEKGTAKPLYIQVEGTDLAILKTACQAGLMPAVTYSFSPTGRYGGRRISHMVSLVGAGEKWFVILDNNYPKSFEWMDEATFRKTYAPGWAIIPLKLGPPPIPRNAGRLERRFNPEE
jgi:hypothetical protein